jgi:hypothetical protein
VAMEADELETVFLDSLLLLEFVVILETCFDSDELVGYNVSWDVLSPFVSSLGFILRLNLSD